MSKPTFHPIKSSKILYKELAEQFRDYIVNGHWKVGNIIPSEMELCKQFTVSRSTLRKAMEYLTHQGYLERRAGKGTWAVDHYQCEETWMVDGISPNYPYPDQVHVEIFAHETLVNDHSDPILCAFEQEPILGRIKALRWFQQTPLNLAQVYMNPIDAEKVVAELDPQKDIYFFKVLERVSGKTVECVKETYEAVAAVSEVAERLQVGPGTPLIQATRLALDNQGTLLVGVRIYLRTDLQKISLSRTKAMTPKMLLQ
jgi:GntR family transcriptional regulator